jgi:hypothetical protein
LSRRDSRPQPSAVELAAGRLCDGGIDGQHAAGLGVTVVLLPMLVKPAELMASSPTFERPR